jgi:hypothetical protein
MQDPLAALLGRLESYAAALDTYQSGLETYRDTLTEKGN